jgi:hypothetical protein
MYPRDVVSHQHELHARDVESQVPEHFVRELRPGNDAAPEFVVGPPFAGRWGGRPGVYCIRMRGFY